MQASFQSPAELEQSFLCYLKIHGQSLNPHQWLKAYDFICRESTILKQERQTMLETEEVVHDYLTLINI